jgi:tRNA(Ile)-lysidine synthase|tara:strand:+ start:766 stop:2175 length:1410 start_codon:yes stop_codon:yes gene_type:complete
MLSAMNFDLDNLASILEEMPSSRSAMVGLSGGMDSIVLLHALHQLQTEGRLGFSLRALHVNHGLQSHANNWADHCVKICSQLEIPLQIENANIQTTGSATSGEASHNRGLNKIPNLENAAREVRYAAFEVNLTEGEVLLLAHHRDDQVETLLFRLMRGAGTKGLSAMPRARKLGEGLLFRPLLDFDWSKLQNWAKLNKLQWVVDKSNEDTSFHRNFIRHKLLPIVEQRWPNYRDSWSKTIELSAESESLLQELAEQDFQIVESAQRTVILLEPLRSLSKPRQRNLLRYWLKQLQLPDLGWNKLQQLCNEVVAGAANSSAIVVGEGYELLCYKSCLYVLRDVSTFSYHRAYTWNMNNTAVLDLEENGSLQIANVVGKGLKLSVKPGLSVRYRSGGESCKLLGRPTKAVKKLMQEHNVEPWFRDRFPLLYFGEELVCIPAIGVAESYAALSGEQGILVEWLRPDLNPVAKS